MIDRDTLLRVCGQEAGSVGTAFLSDEQPKSYDRWDGKLKQYVKVTENDETEETITVGGFGPKPLEIMHSARYNNPFEEDYEDLPSTIHKILEDIFG